MVLQPQTTSESLTSSKCFNSFVPSKFPSQFFYNSSAPPLSFFPHVWKPKPLQKNLDLSIKKLVEGLLHLCYEIRTTLNSNATSSVNEHALSCTRETCSCSQTASLILTSLILTSLILTSLKNFL